MVLLTQKKYAPPGSTTVPDKDVVNLTFEDIRVHGYSGQAFVKAGTGRDKVYGYRHGLMTDIGDIEPSRWRKIATTLIERAGEKDLLQNLIDWEKEHYLHFHKDKSELVQKAMELHVSRIFDDEEWVDFVRFNQRYRPDVLSCAELVDIVPDCCKQPGKTTKALLKRWNDGRTPCPHCGRHSTYQKTKGH